MADSVTPSSETPNQPAVETPVAASAAAAVSPPPSTPAIETPAPDQAAAAKAASDKLAADAATAANAPPADPAVEAAAQAEAAAAAAKVEADKAAAALIPEAYDVQMPKALADKGMSVDREALAAMTPALKKAGLTQAQFQTVAESFIDFQAAAVQRTLERDAAITAKDPTIGGLKYGETLKQVNLALDAFADPDFKKWAKESGIGNRLEFVRVFQRIGEAMARAGDTPSRGSPDGAPELTRAQRMYGRTNPTT